MRLLHPVNFADNHGQIAEWQEKLPQDYGVLGQRKMCYFQILMETLLAHPAQIFLDWMLVNSERPLSSVLMIIARQNSSPRGFFHVYVDWMDPIKSEKSLPDMHYRVSFQRFKQSQTEEHRTQIAFDVAEFVVKHAR